MHFGESEKRAPILAQFSNADLGVPALVRGPEIGLEKRWAEVGWGEGGGLQFPCFSCLH